MISLTCTSCKKGLEIDDAFAGGVCRCQFCGTIQTVPANLKKGGRPGAPVGTAATTQKTLYQKQTAPKTATQPAASSGSVDAPSPTASRTARAAQPGAQQAGVTRNTWIIRVAIGAAAAVLVGIIAWIVF